MSSSSSTTITTFDTIPSNLIHGQLDDEARTLIDLALHRYPTTVSCGQLAHDPEAQAQTSEVPGVVRAFEALEDAGLIPRADPDAVIAHDQPRRAVLLVDRDLDRLAGAVLQRVREQVGQDLIDAPAIP